MKLGGRNSGWLYADMLLALFVIFLAATAGSTPPPPVPAPSPTPTPAPNCTVEVSRDAQHITIPSPDGGLPSGDTLRSKFAPYQGQPIALVLTTVTDRQIGPAQNEAQQVDDQLRATVPDLFSNATMKALGFQVPSGAGRGNVEFEFYLFQRVCSPASPDP